MLFINIGVLKWSFVLAIFESCHNIIKLSTLISFHCFYHCFVYMLFWLCYN